MANETTSYPFHFQDALAINRNLGYDEEDAKTVLYDDCLTLKKGDRTPLEKYGFKGDPKDIGRYLYRELKQKEAEDPSFLPPQVLKSASKKRQRIVSNTVVYFFLTLIALVVILPVLIVLLNSFKNNGGIARETFLFPNAESFVGIQNYVSGFEKTQFHKAFGISLYITVVSTVFILLFSSMTAWFLTRVKTWWTKVIYYAILFSQVVPFQMVMLPMNQIAADLGINHWYSIPIIYVAFGAGLSVFMYAGFVKSVPLEIEEAAMIDGCNPVQTFFTIVFPILKPTTVTIAILNVMWIWNDYLLPYMVLGPSIGETTIPVAVQMVSLGSYGAQDMGLMMAMIVLTMIPIIIFYLFGQKYIIRGVTAGAVKG